MSRQHDVGTHFLCPGDCCIEVLDLEPQQNPIPIRPVGRIADLTMIMFYIEPMQLEYEHAVGRQSLVFVASMRALAAEKASVPAAAGLDIADGNEWLRLHLVRISAWIQEVNVRRIRPPST